MGHNSNSDKTKKQLTRQQWAIIRAKERKKKLAEQQIICSTKKVINVEPNDDEKTEDFSLTTSHPRFPFWARLKIGKRRTTLVIDEEVRFNNHVKKEEDGFVHREAQHPYKKGALKLDPNPDATDPYPMYLKSPSWLPKYLFMPHNKMLDIPKELIDKYDKNNK